MRLDQLLLASGRVKEEDLARIEEAKVTHSADFAEALVRLGIMPEKEIRKLVENLPRAPRRASDLGVGLTDLLALLLKMMFTANLETPFLLGKRLGVSAAITEELLEEAKDRKLVLIMGREGEGEFRYQLTAAGRERAAEILSVNGYVGPVPVTLADWAERVHRQKIVTERISKHRIEAAFEGLVIPDHFLKRIGPAVNSGRSVLLYGPPGNGKTTVAERVAHIFADVIYMPHALEVDGNIIRVFDPSIHKALISPEEIASSVSLRRNDFDERWVPCKRPVVITGGELTLEMLDLRYSEAAGYYEAPLHMKATSGIFIIDDFGRQLVSPTQLLNRWIVPLQARIDYLKLHTGKSFRIPFDELVMFSTNLEPRDLMDPAFLRRIPYKILTDNPSADNWKQVFRNAAYDADLEVADDHLDYMIEQLTKTRKQRLSNYQPLFIVDQVIAAAKFDGGTPEITHDLIDEALSNLYVESGARTMASA